MDRPAAIALGGGFDDEMFGRIHGACKGVPGAVWLRCDVSKMARPPQPGEEDEYAKDTAERIKRVYGGLRDSGKAEGVYLY